MPSVVTIVSVELVHRCSLVELFWHTHTAYPVIFSLPDSTFLASSSYKPHKLLFTCHRLSYGLASSSSRLYHGRLLMLVGRLLSRLHYLIDDPFCLCSLLCLVLFMHICSRQQLHRLSLNQKLRRLSCWCMDVCMVLVDDVIAVVFVCDDWYFETRCTDYASFSRHAYDT